MGNEQENAENIVRLQTQFESLTAFLTRIEQKLDARDEKYVLREQQAETFRLRDQRSRELEKKSDENTLKLEQKIDALQLKIDAGDAALLLKFKELEQEKKSNRRMLPDIIMAISAFGTLGLTLYLVFHK